MPSKQDDKGGGFVQGANLAPPAFYAQQQEDWAARLLDNLRLFGVQLACAGGSAAVAKTVVAPLERVKILLQVQPLMVTAGAPEGGGAAAGGGGTGGTATAAAGAPPSRGAPTAGGGGGGSSTRSSSGGGSSRAYSSSSSAPASASAARRPAGLGGAAAARAAPTPTPPAASPCWRAALSTTTPTPTPRPLPTHLPYTGLLDALKRIPKSEGGWRSLYRGNGANVARLLPEVALRFSVADQFRIMFGPADGSPPSAKERAAAAAAAGALRTLLLYPLDVARTRIAADVGGGRGAVVVGGASATTATTVPRSYTGIAQALAATWRAEGRKGLYRGLGPSLAGSAVYTAAALVAYDELRGSLPCDRRSREAAWYPLAQVGAGAAAGVVAQTLAYPLDTVRRRLQVARAAGACWGSGVGSAVAAAPEAAARVAAAIGGRGSGGPYRGAFDCALRMVRHEGPRALVRGVGVNALKTAPGAAVQFLAYDAIKVGVAWLDPTAGATSPL